MASLLRAAAKAGIAPGYVRRLLAAGHHDRGQRPRQQGLIEPLSERELDVLRLLGTDLDGPDIARELVVSLNTVRTHTKNIYAKLGVQQPSSSGPPGQGARPAGAKQRPLTQPRSSGTAGATAAT